MILRCKFGELVQNVLLAFLISRYLVRLGDLRASRKINCNEDPSCSQQDFDIESIISHPNYDQPRYANDIALIKYKITNPAQRNTPICLPLDNTENLNEELGIVAGWNSMSQGEFFEIKNILNK